ncbi:MAG TPA: hypothetical protein VFZ65_22605 [Planctomycetota bacterium]|nr:hypothetical protein [Planctomycetota bacterium]
MFDSDRRATADVTLRAASSYVFRGQVMTDYPVLQAGTQVDLPTRGGGGTTFAALGNLDLTDRVGRAWFGPDHAGEFTEIDLSVRHTRSFGPVEVAAGLVHYSWANGEQFRFVPFPPTSEVFATVGGALLGFRPAITAHYDIDEVHGLYVRADVGRSFDLGGKTSLGLLGWIAWSNAQHSEWLYRTNGSALADAGLEARVTFDLDEVTALHVGISGSTIVDDGLRDWFSTRIEADNVWLDIGLTWRF